MGLRLIINADDFGLCNAVNKAIIDVFESGNLTSTTMIMNMPGFEDAAKLAKDHPGLAIGLHFCLTEGDSLTTCPTLTDDKGAFIPRSELLKRAIAGKLDNKEIEQEFLAQLDLLRSVGIKVSHVDSHQHVLMIPAVFNAIRAQLEKSGIPIRIVRPPTAGASLFLGKPSKFLKQIVHMRAVRNIKNDYGYATNDYLVSVHDLVDSKKITGETYRRLLANIKGDKVIELMVHPYIVDDDVEALYTPGLQAKRPFLDKCVNEYEVLCQKPLFEDYDLCTYADI